MRVIFILGAGTLQVPAVDEALKLGLKVHIADANPNAAALQNYKNNTRVQFQHIDLRETQALVDCAQRIQEREGLDAVFTAATDFSRAVAHIARACTLAGISPEAAANASYKDRMRRALAKAGIAVPQFRVLSAADILHSTELHKVLVALRLPIVCKPVDNMGARGVRQIDNASELAPALRSALQYSARGTVILEEKIQGAEYSLEGIMYARKLYPLGIARRIIDYPPYFIERGHSFPSGLGESQRREMFQTLHAAALALGIHTGVVKGDVFYSPTGPVIGELAARLSGGFMSGWTLPMHTGVNATRLAIQLALGEDIRSELSALHARPQKTGRQAVSERGIVSIPGRVARVFADVYAPQPEKSELCFIRVKAGDSVHFPQNNVQKCGNIIRTGSPQGAESAVARSFVQLHSESWQALRSILAGSFPSAYPALLAEQLGHFKRRRSAVLSTSTKNTEHSTDSPQTDSRSQFLIPHSVLKAAQQDWNYRSPAESLAVLQALNSQFKAQRISGIPDQAYWRAQEQTADPPAEPGADHYWNYAQLLVLLRAGAQALLYFLELSDKTSEHEITNEVQDTVKTIAQHEELP